MLKKLVTESPILKYYDPNKEMKLSVDASKYGLGAVLLQKYEEDWAPVAYGSRSLTRSEMNYAQIEKETLAILLAATSLISTFMGLSSLLNLTINPRVNFQMANFKSTTHNSTFFIKVAKVSV